ncbi:MAG TPA: M48 family metallopeptidase, partial [Coleofasciculaceae cyanobacterium]
TTDPDEKKLFNIVDEMAIASGISVPAIYVLDREQSINAFAAGYTTNDAVIGVTRGCIQQLSRDELQGVIAHEFSHILNGDMRLNLRLIGILHGILVLYYSGRVILRVQSNSSEKNPAAALGFGLIGIGLFGFFCGNLIKSAVSRQREFLADASAVQFTRNPDGLRGALAKISASSVGSRIEKPEAEVASHLFFGAIGAATWGDFWATHPPVQERIQRLDQFAGRSPAPPAASSAAPRAERTALPQRDPLAAADTTGLPGISGFAAPPGRSPARRSPPTPITPPVRLSPANLVERVGTLDASHLDQARALLDRLPADIQTALTQVDGAKAVIYGLFLDVKPSLRDRQLTLLHTTESPELVERAVQLLEAIAKLDPNERLPLLDLAIAPLRGTSAGDRQTLLTGVRQLVITDERIDFSEYVMQLVLWHRLDPKAITAGSNLDRYSTIESIWPDCIALLAVLAAVGDDRPDAIAYAWRSGVFHLPGASKRTIPDTPPPARLYDAGKCLGDLRQTTPKLKQAILDACARTVLVDNQVTLKEAELLRAIAICLDCPAPPFLRKRSRRP